MTRGLSLGASWLLVPVFGVLAGVATAYNSRLGIMALLGLMLIPILLSGSVFPVYALIFLIPFRDFKIAAFLTAKVLLALFVIGQAALSQWQHRKPLALTSLDRWVAAYVILVPLASLHGMLAYSGDIADAARATGLSFLFASTVYVAVRTHTDVLDPKLVRVVIAVSTFLVSVIAISQEALLRTPVGSLLITTNADIVTGRVIGTFDNPNYLATFLGLGFVVVIVDLLRDQGSWVWRVPVVVTAGSAIWLTYSRGTLLAVAVAMFLYLVAVRRGTSLGTTFLRAAVGLLLIVAVPLAFRNQLDARLALIGGSQDQAMSILSGSDGIRMAMLKTGLEMFSGSPVIGVGYGTFTNLSGFFGGNALFYNSHNEYMAVLAETGMIGLIVFGGLVYQVVSRAIREVRVSSEFTALAVAAIGFLANAFTINSMANMQTVGLFWAVAALLSGSTVTVAPESVKLQSREQRYRIL